jgi:hypothetical protein
MRYITSQIWHDSQTGRMVRFDGVPKNPPRPDSAELRASLKKLLEQSERLRLEAKKNAQDAERIGRQLADLERQAGEAKPPAGSGEQK